MLDDPVFHSIMERLGQGDEAAAEEIFHVFAGRLIALARTHLDVRLRQKVDPEDVMQSALKSFFLRQADGQFDLADWDSLWSLLVRMTLRKCGHQVEHFLAGRRDVRLEISPPTNDSAASWQLLGAEPTPSHAAILAETVEQALRCLGNERERQIVTLSLQGFEPAEIGTQVGRSERTVNRVLNQLRQQLQRMRDEDATV